MSITKLVILTEIMVKVKVFQGVNLGYLCVPLLSSLWNVPKKRGASYGFPAFSFTGCSFAPAQRIAKVSDDFEFLTQSPILKSAS